MKFLGTHVRRCRIHPNIPCIKNKWSKRRHGDEKGNYERLVAINEKTFGSKDIKVAYSQKSLAELYSLMGEYDKAKVLLEHSLKIYENTLGPDDPNTAASLSLLAILYHLKKEL